MGVLLDQYGNPIHLEDLKEEQATPNLTGVRSILKSATSAGLNPVRLARVLRAADEGDIEEYLEMAEELEEKEGHYHSVLGTRKRSVAQLEITVEAASDDKKHQQHAEFIEHWLDRDCLEEELVDILDAIGKGFSVMEIIWDTRANEWMPGELKYRDPRWFEFDRTDGETLYLRDLGQLLPLTPYKYVVHKHKAKSGLPIRGGVVRPVFWMYLFKNFSIKDWVIFAEAYGQPIRVGKYGPNTSQADKNVLRRAVANIGSDAAAIIPESMQIEFIESHNKSQTADVFEKLARFCDEQTSKIVLGQTMTTDNGSSRSQAEVHNEVKHDIERSDAKQLAATLNRQLVRAMIDLNFGAQETYPRIRIGRSENVDIEKVSTAADKLVRMGVRVSESDLRQKVGFAEPESDEDTIRLPAATPAAPDQAPSVKTELAAQQQQSNEMDELIEAGLNEWEEVLNPIKTMIEMAGSQSSSYEEFQQRLLEIADQIDMKPAADSIARTMFTANLAGQVDYKFKGDE